MASEDTEKYRYDTLIYTLKKLCHRLSHENVSYFRLCRGLFAQYSFSVLLCACSYIKGHGRMYRSYTFSMSLVLEYLSSTRRSRIRREIDDRDRTASKRFDRDQVDSRRRISRCRRLVFGECEEDMGILLIPNESRSSNNPPPDALNSQKRQKLGSNHARRMCRKKCVARTSDGMCRSVLPVSQTNVSCNVSQNTTHATLFFSVLNSIQLSSFILVPICNIF